MSLTADKQECNFTSVHRTYDHNAQLFDCDHWFKIKGNVCNNTWAPLTGLCKTLTGILGIVSLVPAGAFVIIAGIGSCPLYFPYGLPTCIKNMSTMSQHVIETQWMGKMQFNTLVNGHTVIMDAPERVGGEDAGPIPKPFVLTALSGCTGMDIVAILRNAKKEVKDLNITVTGELSKQKPIEYLAMHIVYDFKGDELYKEAALDAVTVSQEKYCGVSRMLRKALPVTWEVIYNGAQVFNNKITESKIHEN